MRKPYRYRWGLRTILTPTMDEDSDGRDQFSRLLAIESYVTTILKWINATFSEPPNHGTAFPTTSILAFSKEHLSPDFMLAQDPRKFSHARPVERLHTFHF